MGPFLQDYGIPGSSVFTISLLVFKASAVVLSSVMHFVHVNSELLSMVSESVPQPTTANFDLGLSGLVPLPQIQRLFHQPSRYSYAIELFELTSFW